jgi:hypothetical protein
MIKGQPKQIGTFLLRHRNMVGSILGESSASCQKFFLRRNKKQAMQK